MDPTPEVYKSCKICLINRIIRRHLYSDKIKLIDMKSHVAIVLTVFTLIMMIEVYKKKNYNCIIVISCWFSKYKIPEFNSRLVQRFQYLDPVFLATMEVVAIIRMAVIIHKDQVVAVPETVADIFQVDNMVSMEEELGNMDSMVEALGNMDNMEEVDSMEEVNFTEINMVDEVVSASNQENRFVLLLYTNCL